MQDTKSAKDKSLGELFGDLTRETSTLVRQEVQLAKTEMTQKAAQIGKNLVFAVAGAVLGLGAFLAFIAFLIFALAIFLKIWLAALVVTIVLGALAAALAFKGIAAIKNVDMVPKATVETLKDDVRWAKEQAR